MLAHDVVKRMEYLKEDVQTASEKACKNMTKHFKGIKFYQNFEKLLEVIKRYFLISRHWRSHHHR